MKQLGPRQVLGHTCGFVLCCRHGMLAVMRTSIPPVLFLTMAARTEARPDRRREDSRDISAAAEFRSY